MPRKKVIPIAVHGVYDADSGEMVDLTEPQVELAHDLHRRLEAASIFTGLALLKIRQDRLYLALGHASFNDYISSALPFGRTSAYNFMQVAERIQPLLPASTLESTGGVIVQRVGQDGDDDGLSNELESLGIRKLLQITKASDSVLDQVVREGKVVMPDGETEYSLEDLRDMTSAEVRRVMEDARMERDAYRARIQQLEEKLRLEKSERQADADKLKKAESLIDEARHLEALYTRDKLTYEQTETLLQEAQHHLFESRRRLMNVELTEESGEGLKKLLRECIDEIQRQAKAVTYHHWPFLLEDDYERALFMDWTPGQDLISNQEATSDE